MIQRVRIALGVLLICMQLLGASSPSPAVASGWQQGDGPEASNQLYIPMLTVRRAPRPGIHAPFFTESFITAQAAIAWFGGPVNSSSNYADIRVGYTPNELVIRLQVFDRFLWYDASPDPADFTKWDAASLYLDIDGSSGERPAQTSYRFDTMLSWWEDELPFQASYQGGSGAWQPASIPFTAKTGWRGNAPNDSTGDRGWNAIFTIPFRSLGLDSAPRQDSRWGMGIVLHDRDGANASSNPVKTWPRQLDPSRPNSFGNLWFGLGTYTPPAGGPGGEVTVRHGLNGAVVKDGMAGGSSTCGEGTDFWQSWGEANYAGAEQVNVQNQADVADFPCFSKFYLTFPLNAIPAGKTIQSATLTLYQIGNAGGGKWGSSPDSLIQVLAIYEDWREDSLNWNNAPQAVDNVSQAWVKPVAEWPGWPGVPWSWDLSRAVAEAYARNEPLRIALYSADSEINSGKYFASSDYGDWNAEGRPSLKIVWGEP